jgi:hypothetical protein
LVELIGLFGQLSFLEVMLALLLLELGAGHGLLGLPLFLVLDGPLELFAQLVAHIGADVDRLL